MMERRAAWTSSAVAVAAAAIVATAMAQTVDVERPRTFVVGTPIASGGARVDRVDAARTGRSRAPLPTGDLRSMWRTPVGAQVDVTPLVDGRGTIYVVGTRGEVVALGPGGTERWRVSTGAMQPGPPVLLSDDTLVFADAAGEALALHDAVVRWRVRFGRPGTSHPAPLALEDGGAVVATTRDLALLDADGHERARITLPEPTSFPLVAALGKVVAVTTSGAVWTWAPGSTDLTRVGSFGGPVDGGAALVDERTLVAVTGSNALLSAVDLVRGTTTTRAIAPSGLWLGPPATRDGAAYLLLLAPGGESAVAVDSSGAEVLRTPVFLRPPAPAADGGPAQLVAAPHTAPLVDAAGTVAFATLEGGIGVASGRVVDLLPDACPPGPAPGRASAVAALAPIGPGAFMAACRSGTLLGLRGRVPGRERDRQEP
jgi:outer membrane protein assembly factor BamB